MSKKQDAVARRGYAKVNDYQAVFNTVQGRAVLHDLMSAHNMLHPTYTKDVNEMLLNEGERRVILRILTFINTDVKQLLERIEEHEKSLE